MSPASWRRAVVRGVAFALLAALLVSTGGGIRRYLDHRRENRRLAKKVAETEVAVERKRSLSSLAERNDDLLESEARRQLGLIGEDEIEFRFVTDDGGGEKVEVSPPAS